MIAETTQVSDHDENDEDMYEQSTPDNDDLADAYCQGVVDNTPGAFTKPPMFISPVSNAVSSPSAANCLTKGLRRSKSVGVKRARSGSIQSKVTVE